MKKIFFGEFVIKTMSQPICLHLFQGSLEYGVIRGEGGRGGITSECLLRRAIRLVFLLP